MTIRSPIQRVNWLAEPGPVCAALAALPEENSGCQSQHLGDGDRRHHPTAPAPQPPGPGLAGVEEKP